MNGYQTAYAKEIISDYPCICGHDSMLLMEQQDLEYRQEKYHQLDPQEQRRNTSVVHPSPTVRSSSAPYEPPVKSISPSYYHTIPKPFVNTVRHPSSPPIPPMQDVYSKGYYSPATPTGMVIVAPSATDRSTGAGDHSQLMNNPLSYNQRLRSASTVVGDSPNNHTIGPIQEHLRHQNYHKTGPGVVGDSPNNHTIGPIQEHLRHQNYGPGGGPSTPRSVAHNYGHPSLTPVSQHYMHSSPGGVAAMSSLREPTIPLDPTPNHRRIHTMYPSPQVGFPTGYYLPYHSPRAQTHR